MASPERPSEFPEGGGARNRLPFAVLMNHGARRRRAAIAIVLLTVFAAALPAATAFHDHPEHPETECEICAVATTPVTVVRDGSALSVRVGLPGFRVVEVLAEAAPPTLRANGARAPPA